MYQRPEIWMLYTFTADLKHGLNPYLVVNRMKGLLPAKYVIKEIFKISVNPVTTHSLSDTEILRPLIHWVSQKLCDHSFTGCRRNSATTISPGVAEILRPLIHWMSRKYCDHSNTGCCRNSASSHSLDVAEIHSRRDGYWNITVFLQPVRNRCHKYSVN